MGGFKNSRGLHSYHEKIRKGSFTALIQEEVEVETVAETTAVETEWTLDQMERTAAPEVSK